MGFFRRTRRAVKTSGIIALKSLMEYRIGSAEREIKELERKKEAYKTIRGACGQLFGRSQEEIIHDYVTNEKVN